MKVLGVQEFEELLIQSQDAGLSLKQIERMFPYPLDGFQKEAVAKSIDGASVVVCAPTGAGKTVVAVAAAVPVLAAGQRVIYTTPLKALSNQKLYELQVRSHYAFQICWCLFSYSSAAAAWCSCAWNHLVAWEAVVTSRSCLLQICTPNLDFKPKQSSMYPSQGGVAIPWIETAAVSMELANEHTQARVRSLHTCKQRCTALCGVTVPFTNTPTRGPPAGDLRRGARGAAHRRRQREPWSARHDNDYRNSPKHLLPNPPRGGPPQQLCTQPR